MGRKGKGGERGRESRGREGRGGKGKGGNRKGRGVAPWLLGDRRP